MFSYRKFLFSITDQAEEIMKKVITPLTSEKLLNIYNSPEVKGKIMISFVIFSAMQDNSKPRKLERRKK